VSWAGRGRGRSKKKHEKNKFVDSVTAILLVLLCFLLLTDNDTIIVHLSADNDISVVILSIGIDKFRV
jgi:hypothetical protein